MRNEETTLIHKVCRMWLVMECSLNEESGQKIYLPAVFVPKEKRKRVKKIVSIFLKGVKKCVKPAIKMLAGATAALLTAMWIVPMVTEQRGYSAIGGEYLLIVLAAFVAIHIADRLIGKR